jgi:signal transduction histidine kinase
MNSLESRLQLGLFLSLLLLAGILIWGGGYALQQVAESYVSTRLEHDAESVLRALNHPSRHKKIRMGRLTPVYLQPFSGHYFQVQIEGEEMIRSRSLWDQTLEIPDLAQGEVQILYLNGPEQQPLLVRVAGYQKRSQQLTLAVAEDLSEINQQIGRYQRNFLFAALTAIALLLLVQRLVVRHTLQRLDQVPQDMKRLERGEISQLSESVPDEVQPLVQEFNRILALLGQRLERSRNALGNLAHAIKTPLSLLQREIESNRFSSLEAQRQQLQTQAERIQRITERELRRARLAGAGTPGQRFDAAAEMNALITSLRLLHSAKRLDIHCSHAFQSPLPLDREDILELLGSLLDNACKWARQQVRCELSANTEIFQITIEDDGPGVSAADLDRLTQRGVRIDENMEGHGLGLAIVRDIVKLYSGEIRFLRSSQLGGLQILVRLALHH